MQNQYTRQYGKGPYRLCSRRCDGRTRFRILLLVFLVLALLCASLYIRKLSAVRSPVTMSRITSFTEEDTEQFRGLPEVWDWLLAVREKDPSGIYVLRYQAEEELGNERARRTVYLICRPSAGYMKEVNEKKEYDRRKRPTLILSFQDTSDSGWAHADFPLTRLSFLGDHYAGLKIIVDGQEMDYELQDSGTDPDPLMEDLPWEAEYHIQEEEER